MSTGNDIRNEFLNFFKTNDHSIEASSPIVPETDKTLLFTNSGMVQFKNYFTGVEQPKTKRATTSQKCVRAGGKHNDLDNVGHTARHHTFFEMLGNFSFGDYFKEEAISFHWELISKTFELPKDKLIVTVYADDDEAFDLWRKIANIDEQKIIRIPTSDNFWSMGDTGPCGPCSEVFYDHGPSVPGGPPGSPDEDGDRFVEFCNLVFMQYEQIDADTRVDLPNPSIDTGMGLERMTAIIQGFHDNYDTDLFRTLIEASAETTGVAADGPMATSHRVIADHLRCAAFLIAEGVTPSNEGRGYVLRRIMRRGMRHAHMLGAQDPLMHRLLPSLVDLMGGHYTELVRAQSFIAETLRSEEERFQTTLGKGMSILETAEGKLGEGQALPGDVAFQLYDTYGFPIDLTQDVLRERGREVDMDSYNKAMDKQRETARAAQSGAGDSSSDKAWFTLRDEIAPTQFIGYDQLSSQATVTGIMVDGESQTSIEAGTEASLIFDRTPFYAEMGGQVGDAGTAVGKTSSFNIRDVQKRAGVLFAHTGTLESGKIAVGDKLDLTVNAEQRAGICAHHSATHLLHQALRDRLGDHVAQKGSLVNSDRLRFDISHNDVISRDVLDEVSSDVNRVIRACTPVTTQEMPHAEAMKSGALALFGEKYGDEVRVVTMGPEVEETGNAWSVELCGGTHVSNTGQIGYFRILKEEGLAAGVRRIEAVAHEAAENEVNSQNQLLSTSAAELKTAPANLPERINKLIAEKRALEQSLSALKTKQASGGGSDARSVKIGDVEFSARVTEGLDGKQIKSVAEDLAKRAKGVSAVASVDGKKVSFVVAVDASLTDRLDAKSLIQDAAADLGAKGGGGKPTLAQTGGANPDGVNAAIDKVQAAVEAGLKA